MRLEKIQDLLREKHISFDYTEEEGYYQLFSPEQEHFLSL